MWRVGYAQTNTTHTQNSTGPAVTCASGDGSQDLVQARQVFCHGEVPGALGTTWRSAWSFGQQSSIFLDMPLGCRNVLVTISALMNVNSRLLPEARQPQ